MRREFKNRPWISVCSRSLGVNIKGVQHLCTSLYPLCKATTSIHLFIYLSPYLFISLFISLPICHKSTESFQASTLNSTNSVYGTPPSFSLWTARFMPWEFKTRFEIFLMSTNPFKMLILSWICICGSPPVSLCLHFTPTHTLQHRYFTGIDLITST